MKKQCECGGLERARLLERVLDAARSVAQLSSEMSGIAAKVRFGFLKENIAAVDEFEARAERRRDITASCRSEEDVSGTSAIEAGFFDTLVSTFTDEELMTLIAVLNAAPCGPTAAGVAADQILQAKRRRIATRDALFFDGLQVNNPKP